MDTPLTIQEFDALINSEQDATPLLAALSKLTTLEDPETVTKDAMGPAYWWYGWQ